MTQFEEEITELIEHKISFLMKSNYQIQSQDFDGNKLDFSLRDGRRIRITIKELKPGQ